MNKVIALAVVLGIATVAYAVGENELIADPLKQPPLAIYSVSGSGESAILLDTVSGKTWILRHEAAWIPLSKIDDPQEAKKFMETQVPDTKTGWPRIRFSPEKEEQRKLYNKLAPAQT